MKFIYCIILAFSSVLLFGCGQTSHSPTWDTALEQSQKTRKERELKAIAIRAEQGDLNSQYLLGSFYYKGSSADGITADYSQALKWLKMASVQGDPRSEQLLGNMNRDGLGVPIDLIEARRLYRDAASKGNRDAYLSLVNLVRQNGSAEEKIRLANDLKAGNSGLPADNNTWIVLMREAASMGSPVAIASVRNYEKEQARILEEQQRIQREQESNNETLDHIVAFDARGWISNKYDTGSMKNASVVDQDSSKKILRGEYTFNHGTKGWVKFVVYKDKRRVPCLEFWDSQGECRPLTVTRQKELQSSIQQSAQNRSSSSPQPADSGGGDLFDALLIHEMLSD